MLHLSGLLSTLRHLNALLRVRLKCKKRAGDMEMTISSSSIEDSLRIVERAAYLEGWLGLDHATAMVYAK